MNLNVQTARKRKESLSHRLGLAFIDDVPNLKKLLQHGVHARIESAHPPITIPAWIVMATSKNMGKLGLYGFRHRKPSPTAKHQKGLAKTSGSRLPRSVGYESKILQLLYLTSFVGESVLGVAGV